jgi:RNase adaptor protein for sRNA GlmZ degradation
LLLVLVAGQIGAGKSAVASELARRRSGRLVVVRHALAEMVGAEVDDRRKLQDRGLNLDRRTAGRWLSEYVVERHEEAAVVVIDSVRTVRQTLPLLERLDGRLVYLQAHGETRRARFAEARRYDPLKASLDFDAAMSHPTEVEAARLQDLAQLVVETDRLSVQDVVSEIDRHLGPLP